MSAAVDAWAARGRVHEVGGHQLFALDLPAVDEQAEPVVILHGFPTSSLDWHHVVDHLAVSNAGNAQTDLARTEGEPEEDAMLLERGRGLTIVRAFTDSLAIVNVDGRTVARAVRLLST